MSKNPWYKGLPWIRFIITIIALLVIAFCLGLIIYGRNSTSNDIALGIITGITAVFALGQWLFPFSPIQSEVPHLRFVRKLVRESFSMGDNDAAYFPYITKPIQYAYAGFQPKGEEDACRMSLLPSGKRGQSSLTRWQTASRSRVSCRLLKGLTSTWTTSCPQCTRSGKRKKGCKRCQVA